MIAILSIIAVVAGISLYDFFSARRWQQVTSTERNELVFAHRNKEYGAFAIRRDYNLRVMLIMGCMVFAIGSAYGIYKIIQNLPEDEVPEAIDTAAFTMAAPTLDEELDPPPPEKEIPPMERTVQFLPPVVSDDVPETEQVVSDEEVKVSTETNETDNESFEIVEKPKEKEKVVEQEKPEIFTYVDEPAEFPGGQAALRAFLRDNMHYPQTAVELGIEGKCYLQFVVSASGNISNVTVQRGVPDCPECDKEAVRVVKAMPKWKPGKNGGKEVHSTFNLPVTFKLQ